jgi:hypothetical protein
VDLSNAVSKVGPRTSVDMDTLVCMPSWASIPPATWHVKEGHKKLAIVEKEQLFMKVLLIAAGPSF